MRDVCEWAHEVVRPPGSARSDQFDINETPWLKEPLEAIHAGAREVVLLMPTGAGKTTIFDVTIANALARDPSSILMTLQNDAEADGYWEERLIPILEGIPDVATTIADLPKNKKKKGQFVFPYGTLYCSSAKWKALQRKSVRRVLIDEAWMVPHGFIEEGRARTHDRWDEQIILASQGGDRFIEKKNGEIVQSELEEAFDQTNKCRFSIVCPECGEIHPWTNSGIIFEDARTETGDLDERGLMESARYRCAGRCKTEFPDTLEVREMLSRSSVYVPSSDRFLPRHFGYHTHAAALFYIGWGKLALQWKKANMAKRVGNFEPLKIYIQKRCAEFWEEQEHRFNGINSDAPASDYVIVEDRDRFPDLAVGFPWKDESFRLLAGDWQQLDGHYFVGCAAAFSADGSLSRVLWAGRENDAEALRRRQIDLGITDKGVVIDCADDTATINAFCRQYGWMELLGADRENWPHKDKKTKEVFYLPWSVPEQVGGIGPDAPYRISWSNAYYHDLHARRLAHHGIRYGVPADIEDFALYVDPGSQKPTGFWPQMRATQKVAKPGKDGKRVMKYVRIGKRPDHYTDARRMLLVRASFECFRKGKGWQLGEEDFKAGA